MQSCFLKEGERSSLGPPVKFSKEDDQLLSRLNVAGGYDFDLASLFIESSVVGRIRVEAFVDVSCPAEDAKGLTMARW